MEPFIFCENLVKIYKIADLEEQIQKLEQILLVVGPSIPPTEDIVDELPSHASHRYDSRPLTDIRKIVLHHSAAKPTITPMDLAEYQVHEQDKPVASVCIAPALIAKVLGDEGPELTIGTDADTAAALTKMGAAHVECPVTEFVVDREKKLISSPAYMLAQSISEAAEGIEKTVKDLIDMA